MLLDATHKGEVATREFAGEPTAGRDKLVEVGRLPRVGRPSLPIDFAHARTDVAYGHEDAGLELRAGNERRDKELVGTQCVTERRHYPLLVGNKETAQSVGYADPIRTLANLKSETTTQTHKPLNLGEGIGGAEQAPREERARARTQMTLEEVVDTCLPLDVRPVGRVGHQRDVLSPAISVNLAVNLILRLQRQVNAGEQVVVVISGMGGRRLEERKLTGDLAYPPS